MKIYQRGRKHIREEAEDYNHTMEGTCIERRCWSETWNSQGWLYNKHNMDMYRGRASGEEDNDMD